MDSITKPPAAAAATGDSLDGLFARLTHWDRRQFGLIPVEAVDEMKAHPAFVPAASLLMRKMLDLNAHDPLQASIRKDVGRYFCAVVALYLDAPRSGAQPSRSPCRSEMC